MRRKLDGLKLDLLLLTIGLAFVVEGVCMLLTLCHWRPGLVEYFEKKHLSQLLGDAADLITPPPACRHQGSDTQ